MATDVPSNVIDEQVEADQNKAAMYRHVAPLSSIDRQRIDKMQSIIRSMPPPLKPLAVKAAPKIKPKAPPKEIKIKIETKSPFFARPRDAPDTRLPAPLPAPSLGNALQLTTNNCTCSCNRIVVPISFDDAPFNAERDRRRRYRDMGTAVSNLIVENMQLALRVRKLEKIVRQLVEDPHEEDLKSNTNDV